MGNCCRRAPEQDLLLESKTSSSSELRTPRAFQAIGYNVMCALCDQPIATLFETRKDSRGTPYHAQCCRCTKCGRSLAGEAVIAREGKGYCRLHAQAERAADVVAAVAGASVLPSTKAETAHVDVAELCEAMIDRIVMMPPTCASCGGTFSAKDEVRLIGMLKLHADCVLGRPGPGRAAAVPQKSPLQLAKLALEYLAIRVMITADTLGPASPRAPPPSVYTVFVARNEAAFQDVLRMKASAHGAAPVTVPYAAVANAHLNPTKRGVPSGVLSVVDVSGNYAAVPDAVRSSGEAITAVLTRVECGVRAELRVNIIWQRAAGVLTVRGASLFYDAQPAPL